MFLLYHHFPRLYQASATLTDDLDLRRRRAAYRAAHRGTKEMDWLLGRFALARIAGMSPDELTRFERLLALGDPEIESWIFGTPAPELSEFADLVAALRDFHGIEGSPRGAQPGDGSRTQHG